VPSISSDGRRALIPRHVCVVAEQVRGAANADVDVPLEASTYLEVLWCGTRRVEFAVFARARTIERT
jgi:hypothetical protein